MKLLGKLLVLTVLLREGKFSLSRVEWEMFLNLAQITQVKDCLFGLENVIDATGARMVKTLSKLEMPAVFLRRETLRRYLESIDMRVYRWTVVVLKERSLRAVDYFKNKEILSSYFWLVFDASNGTLRQELKEIEIPFDCAFLYIENINDNHYVLYEYYKIKKNVPGVFRKFAEWVSGGLVVAEQDWYDRKSDMQKYEFVTVKFNEELYLTPKDKVNEEIWEELSNLLNFTIVNKIIEYSIENGHMDLDTEEDEALLDTQIYLGKTENYTYLLGPISQSRLFMHVRVSGEDIGIARFLKPFSRYTWISTGLWILFSGAVVATIDYAVGKIERRKKQRNDSLLAFFVPLHALCNQGDSEVKRTPISRFVLFSIRISGSVIYYAYSATFISYLLLFIPQLPFTTLKGFVEDGTYKIEGERNSDVDTYFSISPNPLERLVYEKFLSDVKGWSRFDKAVDRMCAGEKLVLVGVDDDIEKYKPCNIVKIKKPLKVFADGFKLRFRSPFRGILHIKLLMLRNTGILHRVNSKILTTKKKYEGEEKYEINVEKVFSVFVLLMFGCGFSLGILTAEIFIWKLKNREPGLPGREKGANVQTTGFQQNFYIQQA